MKKILIALALGLLLVSMIATPVLAKPTKGALVPSAFAEEEELTAIGSASLAPTHTNNVKVTVALRRAKPNTTYSVSVKDITNGPFLGPFYFTTNSRGNGRLSIITTETYTEDDTVEFRVSLTRAAFMRLWWDPPLFVTF